MFEICEWPNGDWCDIDDVEEYQRNKSDDYSVISFDSYEAYALHTATYE